MCSPLLRNDAHTLISTWINVILYISTFIHIYSVLVSWKNRSISGKIMEFDSGIRLETLEPSLLLRANGWRYVLGSVCPAQNAELRL